ncbi:universal stress protein [Trinickia mobilis]|uniref:universal stress protein n=1 Tax=Trinickia mobilis TaxID=2816356 RepID=UPI001A8DD86F|nr:universal stress protein [Trinickia mobilis]
MFKHLLVPTDGSALSDAAIRMAVTLAGECKAKLTGLHVMPEYRHFVYSPEMLEDTEERFLEIAQQHADDYLGAIAKAASEAGVECETIATTQAHPYEAIVSVAAERNCDLIVMASHGRAGVRALLIGSETQKVLTHSKVPVLVVRPSVHAGTPRAVQSGASSGE